MPHFHDNALIGAAGAGGGASQGSRSLRFNSADSASLSRTIGTAGNRKTWTWSGWVKRSALGALNILFSSGADGSNNLRVGFEASDKLSVSNEAAGVTTTLRLTTAVYRDPGAWMHIVLALDTTLATAADRVKLYVNGAQVTAFDTNNAPTQNADLNCNNVGTFYIGRNFASNYLNAYLADVHFVSGSALTPSSFGETDSITGQWVRKAFTGSYGTNGHRLLFSDNSAATAAALGADTSGGGNNFTPNNLSVTAGSGNDSMVDMPTSYGTDTGLGGEVRGNYCTLNPLIATASVLSNGNLDFASTGLYQSAYSSIGMRTGKWYFEATVGTFANDAMIGISSAPYATSTYVGSTTTSWGYEGAVGRKYTSANFTAYGSSFGAGDLIGVAFDADTGKLWFAKNGVWQVSGNPATGANPAYTVPTGTDYLFGVSGGPSGTWVCNWGARPFAYTAPSGFKALCDTNLPAPTIVKPSTAMDVLTWTGNSVDGRTISGLSFSPDMVWWKKRSGTSDHYIHDAVRGLSASSTLSPNVITPEQYQFINSFTSSGFTVNADTVINQTGSTYVAWCWDAGSSTVTNNDGTVSSQVRANASAGFSIATFTTPAASQSFSVGHGLGVKPSMTILKARSTTDSWFTWHIGLGDNFTDYLLLYTGNSEGTQAGMWGTVGRTSTVCGFASVISTFASTNYVMYNFAPVAGYSAFGSYTGNSSADGAFFYTGFSPKWVIIKNIASYSDGHWIIKDASRAAPYNPQTGNLYANLNFAEDTIASVNVDFLSNGFKLRGDYFGMNNAAGTYIYAAFAEFPFQYARAR